MKKLAAKLLSILRSMKDSMAAFLASQLSWMIGLALVGVGSIGTGIFLLLGLGFALISVGIFAMLFACIIFRGLS